MIRDDVTKLLANGGSAASFQKLYGKWLSAMRADWQHSPDRETIARQELWVWLKLIAQRDWQDAGRIWSFCDIVATAISRGP
jgi:hypothetical protein